MILETRIKYDTAKLAKEKGVPQTIYQTTYWVDSNGEEINASNIDGRIEEFKNAGYVTAYTQSALQKWLRDEHGLYIEIKVGDYVEEPTFVGEVFGKYKDIDSIMCIRHVGTFDTYEAALEAGLKQALKLIED